MWIIALLKQSGIAVKLLAALTKDVHISADKVFGKPTRRSWRRILLETHP